MSLWIAQLPPLPILVGQRQPLIKIILFLLFFLCGSYMQIDRVRIALLPVVGLPNLYCVIWNSADTQDDHSFPYTPFCPLPFLFLCLFIFNSIICLTYFLPCLLCASPCVLLLIISLLSFRLYSYIYNDLSIYRVFWQPTCSTGPRVEESSNSHILPKLFLYIVAIVDLFVCFVLFTLALKSTWVYPGVVDIPRASTLYIIKYLAGDCVRLDVFVLLRKLWRNNIREKLPMIHSRSWCLHMTLLYFFLFWPCTVYIVLA